MTGPALPHLFVAALAASACTACTRAQPAPWLVNETPSLPRGVYRLTAAPVSRGAIVAVTPPTTARRYLHDLGAPEGARLLKRVAALRGDTVCRRGQQLAWPRGVVTALRRDRLGRALPQWRGCRPLRADELLVLGDTPNSFDSRYFGPVRTAEIDGAYREVWRW
jgi:conjugative transfer signal peptidase TraF